MVQSCGQKVMFQGLSYVHPLFWIFLQTLSYEISGCFSDLYFLWEEDLFLNYFYQVIGMPDLKGTHSIQHLIGQDADRPDVHFTVVVLMLDYFRGSVERSSALGVPQHGSVYSPSKITYLHHVLMQKDVLSFYISVDHILLVHVLYCWAEFLYVFLHIFLLESFLTQLFVYVRTKTRFKKQVNFLCISCVAIDVEDVGIVHGRLNFNLLDEVHEAFFREGCFFDDF